MKLKLDQKIAWVIGTIEKIGGNLLSRHKGWHYVGSEFSAMLWEIFYFLFGNTLPEYIPVDRCKVECKECGWEKYGESWSDLVELWYDHFVCTGHVEYDWVDFEECGRR